MSTQCTHWKLGKSFLAKTPGLTVFGEPAVEREDRECLVFGGEGDGLVVPANPIAGEVAFTIEAIIRPDAGGKKEQRFLHVQDATCADRTLLETRLLPRGWYADTFIAYSGVESPLNDPKLIHPLGKWHSLALTYDGRRMRQFVNGKLELEGDIAGRAPGEGVVAIGMRANRVYWYRGAIAEVRLSARALAADELLRP